MIKGPVGIAFTSFVIAEICLISGCGVMKRFAKDDSHKPGSSEDLAAPSELLKMLELVFNSPEDFEVKMIEAKNAKGVVVERDTYEYAEKKTLKHVSEEFEPDGTLKYRFTRTKGTNDCDDSGYKAEYFGKYTSRSETKLVKKCDVKDNVVEESEFNVDEEGKETLERTMTNERNSAGRVIKKTTKKSGGKTTIQSYVFDEKSRQIEELETEDGKPLEKTVTDHKEGTRTVFVPVSEGSLDLSKEESFERELAVGHRPIVSWGLQNSVDNMSEVRREYYGSSTRSTCTPSSLQLACKKSSKDSKTGTLVSEIETVADAVVFQSPSAAYSDVYSEYLTSDGKLILVYKAAESKKTEFDLKGVQTETVTKKVSYNSKHQVTAVEEVRVSADGKTSSTTKETYTYDSDEVRLLSKVIVKPEDTITYIYNY